MCHHMVFVLPYRASCDAMQELITNNPDKFDNLSQYEIINIAGVDGNTLYPSVETIKSKIKRCERDGKKTQFVFLTKELADKTWLLDNKMIFNADYVLPMITGKIISGICGVALAMLIYKDAYTSNT